jgi:hypothetical protein
LMSRSCLVPMKRATTRLIMRSMSIRLLDAASGLLIPLPRGVTPDLHYERKRRRRAGARVEFRNAQQFIVACRRHLAQSAGEIRCAWR